MNKLLRNISLFIIPILLIIILVPIDKRLRYLGLKNDCGNHAIWIYDRIHNNKKNIDIAFLGSSHTYVSINEKIIEDSLDMFQLDVANLGYCRLGNNLPYVILKDLIKNKEVKVIVLEVREDENEFSHPIFPYLSDLKDAVFAYPFFNKQYFSDIFKNLTYKIEIIQDVILEKIGSIQIESNTYVYPTSSDTAPTIMLDSAKLKRSIPKYNRTVFYRNLQMKYPRAYLRMIHDICHKNDIALCFLYIPSYGSELEKPKEYLIYSKYGKVFMPTKEILDDKSNWQDDRHLNKTGAIKISAWIASQLKMFIKQRNDSDSK